MRAKSKPVGPELPIFGLDSQEMVALRDLEKAVWQYLDEEISIADLHRAATDVRSIRRKKRAN